MRRHPVIMFILMLLPVVTAAAQDSLSVSGRTRPAGFDAGDMVAAGRSRATDVSLFVNEKFADNLSLQVVAASVVPRSSDYGFSFLSGLALQKSYTSSVGVRVAASGGYVPYNLTGKHVPEVYASASVLFNLSSYIGGYDQSRFCEVSTVLGVGYSCVWEGRPEHFLVGNIGVDVSMKVSRRLAVHLEPYVPVRVNHAGLAYGFGTSFGLAYDFSEKALSPTCAGRYFLTLSGGLQVQNSALIRRASAADRLGFHATFGVGRRFTDFFDLKLSAAYSKNTWQVYYGGQRMPAQYYALRLEGEFDILRFAMRNSETFCRFGCGVLAGPEMGVMFKKDLGYSLKKHYVGLAAGIHADYHLGERLRVFLEPRFTLVPYTAQNDDSTSYNFNRNYYDSLFNLNLGLEIAL